MIYHIINKQMAKLHRWQRVNNTVRELSRLSNREPVSYTHLTLPTIYSV